MPQRQTPPGAFPAACAGAASSRPEGAARLTDFIANRLRRPKKTGASLLVVHFYMIPHYGQIYKRRMGLFPIGRSLLPASHA